MFKAPLFGGEVLTRGSIFSILFLHVPQQQDSKNNLSRLAELRDATKETLQDLEASASSLNALTNAVANEERIENELMGYLADEISFKQEADVLAGCLKNALAAAEGKFLAEREAGEDAKFSVPVREAYVGSMLFDVYVGFLCMFSLDVEGKGGLLMMGGGGGKGEEGKILRRMIPISASGGAISVCMGQWGGKWVGGKSCA